MAQSYTVKSGDSMWAIARANGMTLQQLEAANPQIRNSNLIFPGQTLNLGGEVIISDTTIVGSSPTPGPDTSGTRPVVNINTNGNEGKLPSVGFPTTSENRPVVNINTNGNEGKAAPAGFPNPSENRPVVNINTNGNEGKAAPAGFPNPSENRPVVNISTNGNEGKLPSGGFPTTSENRPIVNISTNGNEGKLPSGGFPTTSSYDRPVLDISQNPVGKPLPQGWGDGTPPPAAPEQVVHVNTNPRRGGRLRRFRPGTIIEG